MNKLMKKAALPAAVLMVLTSQQVFATNGMAPHGTGITQKAMGGASTATALNTMNGGSNPASFANIEDGWDIGADLFSPDRGAKISGNAGGAAINGSFDGNESDLFLIPEGGYKKSIGNKSAVGVVVYANGGMNTDYKNRIPIFANNPVTGTAAGIDLQQLIIAPTWAIKAGEDHSFGVSLNLAYQTFEATGLQNFDVAAQTSAVGSVTDNGKDSSTGIGFTVGWQGKVSDSVVLGASYRSKTNMSKFDKYKGLFAEQGDLDMPAAINIGVAWQATPNTLVAVDAMKIKYSDVAAIGNKNPGTNLLGTDVGSGFGWEDQNIFKIGVKQKVNSKIAVLAGYNHGSAPISESQTLFNVLAPATVEDHLTLGLEYELSDKSKITAAYMHAFGNEIKGSNSIDPSFGGGEADIEMSQNSIGLAYSKKF